LPRRQAWLSTNTSSRRSTGTRSPVIYSSRSQRATRSRCWSPTRADEPPEAGEADRENPQTRRVRSANATVAARRLLREGADRGPEHRFRAYGTTGRVGAALLHRRRGTGDLADAPVLPAGDRAPGSAGAADLRLLAASGHAA